MWFYDLYLANQNPPPLFCLIEWYIAGHATQPGRGTISPSKLLQGGVGGELMMVSFFRVVKLGLWDMRPSRDRLTVIWGVDIWLHSQGGINKTERWREWSPEDIFDPCMSKLTGIQVHPCLSQFFISANSLSSFHLPCIQGSLTYRSIMLTFVWI